MSGFVRLRRPPSRHARLLSGALIAALLVPALASCSSRDAPTPAEVQQFVTVKEVTDNLSRLIAFLSTAEQGMVELAKQRPGSADARTLLEGAQVGWQNVQAEVTNYTPAQAKVVPGLANAVVSAREAALDWENALTAATPALSKGTVRSFADLSHTFARARAAESKARVALKPDARRRRKSA